MKRTVIQAPFEPSPLPIERIERRILFVREQRVMLDQDLALLYGVTTGNLSLAVRRNIKRFPGDFMFELTKEETKSLLLQSAMSKSRGGRRTLPYAITEQGVAMLSSVLRSERAVLVNIAIMRAFVKLRELTATHKELAKKIAAIERKYDGQFKVVFDAIRKLMQAPPAPPKRRIGFSVSNER